MVENWAKLPDGWQLTDVASVTVDSKDRIYVFNRGAKPVGVSFCNHQPRTLWRRLDRLRAQWEAVKGKDLGVLVVLRSSAEQTTTSSQGRLAALALALEAGLA